MKHLIIICLFVVVGCNNSGSQKSANQASSSVPENAATVAVEFSIQGMSCTGCEQTIQTGISSIKGVKHVKANFRDGKAFVEFAPEMADTTQMKEKITASGYIVSGIKTIPVDSLRSKL